MRRFSDTEKSAIKKLLEAKDALYYSLSTIYSDLTTGIEISNDGSVFVNTKEKNPVTAQKQIIHTTLLFHWLAENRYIWIVSYGAPDLMPRENISYIYGSPFPIPPSIFKLYKQYYSCAVFISQDLIDLVNNDFKTDEDKTLEEAKKQTKRAGWTLLFAIITCVLSIVIPICCNGK